MKYLNENNPNNPFISSKTPAFDVTQNYVYAIGKDGETVLSPYVDAMYNALTELQVPVSKMDVKPIAMLQNKRFRVPTLISSIKGFWVNKKGDVVKAIIVDNEGEAQDDFLGDVFVDTDKAPDAAIACIVVQTNIELVYCSDSEDPNYTVNTIFFLFK